MPCLDPVCQAAEAAQNDARLARVAQLTGDPRQPPAPPLAVLAMPGPAASAPARPRPGALRLQSNDPMRRRILEQNSPRDLYKDQSDHSDF